MKALAFTVAAAALIAAPAFADEHSEVVQAATHAGLASQASDIAGVHAHMHHALNCLVGPGGNGFDAKEMNPCAGAGAGAIPDDKDAKSKATLEHAAAELRAGITDSDATAAKRTATAVGAMLKKVE